MQPPLPRAHIWLGAERPLVEMAARLSDTTVSTFLRDAGITAARSVIETAAKDGRLKPTA